jgi:hypothetical protein
MALRPPAAAPKVNTDCKKGHAGRPVTSIRAQRQLLPPPRPMMVVIVSFLSLSVDNHC